MAQSSRDRSISRRPYGRENDDRHYETLNPPGGTPSERSGRNAHLVDIEMRSQVQSRQHENMIRQYKDQDRALSQGALDSSRSRVSSPGPWHRSRSQREDLSHGFQGRSQSRRSRSPDRQPRDYAYRDRLSFQVRGARDDHHRDTMSPRWSPSQTRNLASQYREGADLYMPPIMHKSYRTGTNQGEGDYESPRGRRAESVEYQAKSGSVDDGGALPSSKAARNPHPVVNSAGSMSIVSDSGRREEYSFTSRNHGRNEPTETSYIGHPATEPQREGKKQKSKQAKHARNQLKSDVAHGRVKLDLGSDWCFRHSMPHAARGEKCQRSDGIVSMKGGKFNRHYAKPSGGYPWPPKGLHEVLLSMSAIDQFCATHHGFSVYRDDMLSQLEIQLVSESPTIKDFWRKITTKACIATEELATALDYMIDEHRRQLLRVARSGADKIGDPGDAIAALEDIAMHPPNYEVKCSFAEVSNLIVFECLRYDNVRSDLERDLAHFLDTHKLEADPKVRAAFDFSLECMVQFSIPQEHDDSWAEICQMPDLAYQCQLLVAQHPDLTIPDAAVVAQKVADTTRWHDGGGSVS